MLPLLLGVGELPTWSQTEKSILRSTFKQITQGYTIAQTSEDITITAKDLKEFAQIVKKQRSLAKETEQKILDILKNEGLSGRRFREIAQQKSDSGVSLSNFSDEELQQFKNVFPKVNKIAREDILKQRELIKSQGFTIQKFNAIAIKVQNDTSLQREVLKLMGN